MEIVGIIPTVCPDATSLVVYSYGCDDDRVVFQMWVVLENSNQWC